VDAGLGGAPPAGAGGVARAGSGGSAGAPGGSAGAPGGSAGAPGGSAGSGAVGGFAGSGGAIAGGGGTAGVAGETGAAGTAGGPTAPCEGDEVFEWALVGKSYCFVTDSALSWADAETACETWGGTLAVITTSQENAFLAERITDYTWLGASDAATEGAWEWVNGEAWSYQSFAPDEPNASGNCLHMWHADLGEWDDIPCDTVQSYLCEAS